MIQLPKECGGYPIATIAFYGPTADFASKVAVAVFRTETEDPDVLERFLSQGTDVRFDESIGERVSAVNFVTNSRLSGYYSLSFQGGHVMESSRVGLLRAIRRTILCLSIAILSTFSSGQVSFLEPLTFQAGVSTVYADFNRDGKLDIASNNPLGTAVLLLGNGDGTFKTPINLGVSGNLIATADFDGDGIPDLLVASTQSTLLNVLLGNGDGTFQPVKATDVGVSFFQISAADVSGDGKPDVLGLAGTQVFVFLGIGDGTFKAGAPYAAGPQPQEMLVGDFTGNGKLDIAIANGGTTPEIAVMLGNGDGTFQAAVTSTTGVVGPVSAVVSDVNGDHKLDLIISDSDGNQTYTFLGNGNGTFQAGIVAAPVFGTLGVADLNSDGKSDLVVGSIGNNPYSEILLGNGDGTFTYTSAYATPAGGGNVLIADFNNDGKPDVSIGGGTMLLGNGDGTFKGQPVAPLADSLAAAVGDFNGDGNLDLAVTSSNSSSGVYILLGNGKGTLALERTYTLSAPCYSIAAGDLNGDGKLDLAIFTVNQQNWSLTTMLGNGDGTFGAPTVYQGGLNAESSPPPVVIADLRGDHKPYVATLQGDSLVVFPNNGDGTFGASVSYFAGSQANGVVMADFNNDGKLDAAVSSSAGIGILLGNGDGTFQAASFMPVSGGGTCCIFTGDLNNDGIPDLLVGGLTLLGKGDGTFTLVPSGLTAGVDRIADFNGDGVLDVLEGGCPMSTSQFTKWCVSLGNGDGTFGSSVDVMTNYGQLSGFSVIADFNRDNKPDIAIELFPGGLFILLNTTAGGSLGLQASGSSSSTVAAGSTAIYTLSIGGAGISGETSLTCTGVPTGTSCSISPASLTVSATSASSVKVTVTTTSRTMAALAPSRSTPAPWFWAVAVIGVVMLPGSGIRRWSAMKYLRVLPLGLALLLCSCGAGHSSSNGQQTNPNGTPAGSYTLTVTAKSSSVTQSMQLKLTVQ